MSLPFKALSPQGLHGGRLASHPRSFQLKENGQVASPGSSAAGQFPLVLILQSPGTKRCAEHDNICRQRLKGSLQVT